MHFPKQVVILLAASVAVITTAQEAKETPKAVQEVLAVSAKADAQADADLAAAQKKALAKKIEGRKAAIKAAESAIRTAAIKGDASLEALVATKTDLQTQIKDLEAAASDDVAAKPARTLQVDMAAAMAARDSAKVIALLQGEWRSQTGLNLVIRGTKAISKKETSTLSIVGGRVHYACPDRWSTDFKFVDDTFVSDVHTFSRVK